jgi:hypothetical protein
MVCTPYLMRKRSGNTFYAACRNEIAVSYWNDTTRFPSSVNVDVVEADTPRR